MRLKTTLIAAAGLTLGQTFSFAGSAAYIGLKGSHQDQVSRMVAEAWEAVR